MKKLIALLLALAMVAMMGACTSGNTNETEAIETTESIETTEMTDATEEVTENDPTEDVISTETNLSVTILENIWNAYGDDEKFPVIGGNIEDAVDGAPGNYNMAYAENLTYNLLVPAQLVVLVDEAASIVHMMNANSFTASVLHLIDGVNVDEFVDAMYDAINTNPWMCGFPEHMVIAVIDGSYVLVSFGVNDAMTPFKAHLNEVYADAEIVYDEALAG